MVFSKYTPNRDQNVLVTLSTNGTPQQYEKYLGLSPMIGREKKKAFSNIKDRIWQKLQTWNEKNPIPRW